MRHTVEVFEIGPDQQLQHVETLSDDLLVSPNDVAATGPSSVYVSNDHAWQASWARTLEDYLRLPLGNVVYLDEQGARVAHEGTLYANGLAWDGGELWLAETTGKVIRRLRPAGAPHQLEIVESYEVGAGPDNLTIDAFGGLWTGAHPKMLDFVEHSHDPSGARSASEVLRISPGHHEAPRPIAVSQYGRPALGGLGRGGPRRGDAGGRGLRPGDAAV